MRAGSEKSPKTDASYQRYRATNKIEGAARREALKEYVQHYSDLARTDRKLLNQKLPRSAFEKVLNKVGSILQTEAALMSKKDRELIKFLDRNALPPCLGNALTAEVRTFALMLNALAQWVTAERLAMDRFLFSGNVRKELKDLATTCPICPEDFENETVELHHPVRDGRPPFPLSKGGHAIVEEVVVLEKGDADGQKLVDHRRNSKQRYSWKRLRIGCMEQLGNSVELFDEKHRKAGRRILKFVSKETSLTVDAIMKLLIATVSAIWMTETLEKT